MVPSPSEYIQLDRVYTCIGLHDILTYVLTRGLLGLLKGTASAFLILLVKRCRGLSHCPLQGVVKPYPRCQIDQLTNNACASRRSKVRALCMIRDTFWVSQNVQKYMRLVFLVACLMFFIGRHAGVFKSHNISTHVYNVGRQDVI